MRLLPVMENLLAASTVAGRVNGVFWSLVGFTLLMTFLVMLGVLVFLRVYRRGSSASRAGATDHNAPLEILLVLVFLGLGMGIFVWAAQLFFEIQRPPADSMNIYIVGKQWMWKMYQPNGREEINELHVPAGKNIKLIMTSQDVIHDFFIPAFRVKQDVLPERYTTMWFNATTPGRYRVYCAQYCGSDHSAMNAWVTVLSPADYQTWLSATPVNMPQVPGTPGTEGAEMATGLQGTFNALGCIACHTPTSSVRAPRLDGIWNMPVRLNNGKNIIADEEYLRESILFPNAKISAGYPAPSLMPSYNHQVTEPQLRELVEFIKSIRDGWPDNAMKVEAKGNPQGSSNEKGVK